MQSGRSSGPGRTQASQDVCLNGAGSRDHGSGTLLVVILVECLDGTAVDQNGLESVDIGSQGKCIVQPGIDAQVPAVIRFVGNFFICPVDHFNNESAMLGDDPHLLDWYYVKFEDNLNFCFLANPKKICSAFH